MMGAKMHIVSICAAVAGTFFSVNAIGASAVKLAAATPRLLPGLYDGQTLDSLKLEDVVAKVGPGDVIVLSELHGNQTHHQHQRDAIKALSQTGRCTVSVGLEFLSWTDQSVIDRYFDGTLGETDFLHEIKWGSDPFDNYREQALFPRQTGGRLLGLNAPRDLTGTISKGGLASLTPEQQKLIPPGFTMGNAFYRERFVEIMGGGHIPEEAMDRYFTAQSMWDESMAWTAAEFLKLHPDHCLAIIVGDFHAQYEGGLPDRLRARGVRNVLTVSQVEGQGLSERELEEMVKPDPRYGARGSAVWVADTPAP